VTALAIPLPGGRAGIERVGDRDCLSAFASCCRAIDELSLVLSYLFRPSPARTRWELLRLPPSDRGQPPLTPLSRDWRLSVPLAPRIALARLASTRRAPSTLGASVSELSSRGPRSRFPAITCLVAAFTATNLDHPPPRRGLAAAPRLLRSLFARRSRLSPRPSRAAQDR
jgi:hypothetical protein